ncbi:hypothetical protein [Leucobacter sp. OH1287]|uniref:hypothetical protein n=1 Tax=Leucobacter sp. OH1287 TaxID=2491049 RepID=UPI000FBD3FB2|nr:hypothetical protein [Leucobacter sp. OH1287]RRD60325.1 hypothetical protein EII30_06090 [Leucobacter sp. OH1287]
MFEIRPTGRMKSLILALIFAAVIAAAVTRSWLVLAICAAVVLLVTVWWCFFAKISLTVTPGRIRILAPLYSRTVELGSDTEVSLKTDDGVNHGLVNWPITGRVSSPAGLRLNMGGSGTAVTVRGAAGELVTVVFCDSAAAQDYADTVKEAAGRL